MGKATVYCEKCGEMIPEKEFDSGRAVVVQGKHYCNRCKAAVAHLLPLPGAPHTPLVSKKSSGIVASFRNPGQNPKSSGIVRAVKPPLPTGKTSKVAAIRPASTTPVMKKKSSGFRIAVESDIPSSDEEGYEPETPHGHNRKAAEKKTALYAAIGGGVLLLIVAIVIGMKVSASNKEKAAAQARIDSGDAAWKKVQEHRGSFPDKPDDTLAVLLEQRDAMKGSSHEKEATSLEKALKAEIEKQKIESAFRDRLREIREDSDPPDVAAVQERLKKLKAEAKAMPKEFQDKIAVEDQRLVRLGMSKRLMAAENFESASPKKYEEAEALYSDIVMACSQDPALEDIGKSAQLKKSAVTSRRDSDAMEAFREIERRVDGLLNDNQFRTAFEATKEFDEVTYGMTPANRKIEELRTRISLAQDAHEKSQQQPPTPPPGPGGAPPGGAPGAAVTLFNGKDLTGWKVTNANLVDWSVAGGEMVGKSKKNDPPKAAQGYDNVLYPENQMQEEYEMEVEVTLIKGSMAILVHYDPTVQKTLMANFDESMPLLKPGVWITASIRVQARKATFFVAGMQAGQLDFAPDCQVKGTIGFYVQSGSEFRIRKATLTPLK